MENACRKYLNLKSLEESSTSKAERKLRELLKEIYPKEKFIFNDREILGEDLLQELDIYIPKKKLAFEYNGVQHYKFIRYFHGNDLIFEHQKNLDKIKRDRCREKRIKLIEIRYDEPLTKEHLLTRIHD